MYCNVLNNFNFFRNRPVEFVILIIVDEITGTGAFFAIILNLRCFLVIVWLLLRQNSAAVADRISQIVHLLSA